MGIKTEEVISFFKRHPQLVPVDDFELAAQKTKTEKKRYLNGKLVWSGNEERFWIQLKLKHRNKPGIASASVIHEGVLEGLVVSALESAERSEPNPWFRFPLWSPLPPDLNGVAHQQTAHKQDLVFASVWPQLQSKTGYFQEHYELQETETVVFRRSEKEQRRTNSKTVFQEWDLQGTKDSWWGRADRAARLSRLERLTRFREQTKKESQQIKGPVSFSPRAFAPILNQIGKWFSPALIYTKTSPLVQREIGEQLFSPQINLIDDGSRIETPLAIPFDLEGVSMQKTTLIHQGRFNAPLYNAYYGALFNSKSTGNAFRVGGDAAELGVVPRALCIEPGKKSTEKIWSEIGSGFAIEEISPVSFSGLHWCQGDLSGWEIKEGKKQGPVIYRNHELNLFELMNQVIDVSFDLEVCGSVQTPVVFIESKS